MTIPVYELYGTNPFGINTAIRTAQNDWLEQALGPQVFTWVNVAYPATLYPMGPSIATGVTNTIAAINGRAGPFILVGTSQGASVISNVYDQIRHGALQARQGDFLAGVTMGNPRRQAGHTFPGCPDPGGRGIDEAPLTDCEDLWWDFAITGDPVACTYAAPFSQLDSEWGTTIWEVLQRNYDGSPESVLNLLERPPANAAAIFAYILDAIRGLWDGRDHVGPHGEWATYQPLLPDHPRTMYQIAIDYISSLG